MWRAAALMLVLGCAHRPPPVEEPPDAPIRTWDGRIAGLRQIAHPRPDIDISYLVPDPSAELRWPLPPNVHPVLEPQFPIARELAASGVPWHDLCARGFVRRVAPGADPVMVEYLAGWCHAVNRDIDLAVAALGNVRRKSTRLADPAAIDLANILADSGSADQAQRVLARVTVGDAALYDILAATYAEVGALDDATVFNNLGLDSLGRPAERCHRLVKQSAIEGRGASIVAAELARMAMPTPNAPADQDCVRLHHLVVCWRHPGAECGAYFADVGIDAKHTYLLTAYDRWPRGRSTTDQWRSIAQDAIKAMPLDGADVMATLALELALGVSPCIPTNLRDLRGDAERIKQHPGHLATLDPRLDAIIRRGRELCSPS
jgi:hypothetical protein